jgi:glutathione S-transferase
MNEGVVTVFGRRDSSAVARVMWTIGELGLPFERLDRGGAFGGLDDPGYLALNPAGRIPALRLPTGVTLWESNAIIRYLTCTHAPNLLWFEDALTRAEAEAWMDWSSSLGGAVGRIRSAYRAVGATVETCRPVVRAEAAVIAVLERRLADRSFLMGESLSMADLSLGVIGHRLGRVPTALGLPATPGISRWLKALAQRPAFRRHVIDAVTVGIQQVGGSGAGVSAPG